MDEAGDMGVGESLDNLRAMKVVGKGATGTVILVHVKCHNSNNSYSPRFALKIIPKTTTSSAHARALSELSILTRLSTTLHPCLPKLLGYFDTKQFIGYATNYCSGGDLNSLIRLNGEQTLSDNVIKFYLSEIVCALHHLHSMGIVYRDLKPENILIQDNGHLLLTDFDLSSTNCLPPEPPTTTTTTRPPNKNKWIWSRSRVSPVSRRRSSSGSVEGQKRNYSFVGTEEYVSPEMVRGGPHGFGVDWWALGVLAYEMLYGTTPFKGRNKKETFFNILMRRPVFFGRSTPLTDFIRWLLEKDPSKRLGYDDIKRHEFFQGVKWDILTQVSRPPFIPSPEEDELLGDGVDLREYFTKLTLPGSLPSSPISVPLEQDYQRDVNSLTDF